MISIIPNRTLVTGNIQALWPSEDKADFCVLELIPSSLDAVDSFVNLLDGQEPGLLHIQIARQVQEQYHLQAGMKIACQVRKAPGKLFVIPDSIEVE
ncbi:hypothetical protein SAMN05421788_103109 [Filimonas lacunae]|uniref:Uncharacterized protein n=1 Tax=Filimonas lacunae TaxID=477680 RepID=A0A173MJV6_9BACT|nr:hypothetical protein [Filimonas lacunae]BAV07759.1 hypothetical protein FLA_3790 [Filimonas lacunae]SIT04445.1 hypothetical protein SAMN05421788_103109 [Filimonas lacunae]